MRVKEVSTIILPFVYVACRYHTLELSFVAYPWVPLDAS